MNTIQARLTLLTIAAVLLVVYFIASTMAIFSVAQHITQGQRQVQTDVLGLGR